MFLAASMVLSVWVWPEDSVTPSVMPLSTPYSRCWWCWGMTANRCWVWPWLNGARGWTSFQYWLSASLLSVFPARLLQGVIITRSLIQPLLVLSGSYYNQLRSRGFYLCPTTTASEWYPTIRKQLIQLSWWPLLRWRWTDSLCSSVFSFHMHCSSIRHRGPFLNDRCMSASVSYSDIGKYTVTSVITFRVCGCSIARAFGVKIVVCGPMLRMKSSSSPGNPPDQITQYTDRLSVSWFLGAALYSL